MIHINSRVAIPESEIRWKAIRSQGAGGQNVNKVASAVQLFFDIPASSLPDFYKERLLGLKDQRVTEDGVLVIKAQEFRTQEKNREAAMKRLRDLVVLAGKPRKTRKPTRRSRAANQRRLDKKKAKSDKKSHRGRVDW